MFKTKISRILMAFLFAFMMCFTNFTPLFSAAEPATGTESEPAQSKITKILTMADGTATPTETFTFSFTKKSVDDDDSSGALATMPEISAKIIAFTGSDAGSVAAGLKTITVVEGGPSTFTVETSTNNYTILATDPTYGDYIEITAGTEITINLKHGQRLVFTDIQVGASYIAEMQGQLDYKYSVALMENGTVSVGSPISNATPNTPRSTAPDLTPSLMRVIGAGTNSAISQPSA